MLVVNISTYGSIYCIPCLLLLLSTVRDEECFLKSAFAYFLFLLEIYRVRHYRHGGKFHDSIHFRYTLLRVFSIGV